MPTYPDSAQRQKILGVAFSPSGQHLASCSADQTIQLWDAATGAPLKNAGGPR